MVVLDIGFSLMSVGEHAGAVLHHVLPASLTSFGVLSEHSDIPTNHAESCHALMSDEASEDITALLVAWKDGDDGALERLISAVYPEMRRIARIHLANRSANQTLESAALANEAYLKLIRAKGIECKNRSHFFALCAQVIRRILVDHARSQGRAKRGGGALQVSLDEALFPAQPRGVDMLALDQALESLSEIDPRKSRVVELRFFGGLSVQESAEVLEVSAETVMRDWKMAKAWLFRQLTGH